MWEVGFSPKARKQARKLPQGMKDALDFLVRQIRATGPHCADWPHFGKLSGRKDAYHCHLNKGKPRYVAVWQVKDKRIQLVEVQYVGTHEKAPY